MDHERKIIESGSEIALPSLRNEEAPIYKYKLFIIAESK
jgi:hypothetical protein